MARTFRRLARGRRLVVFDKRGTGVSERVPLDRLPTLEERVDDVRAVMDAAQVERAALVGISEGGPLSLLFAAAHPERVDRLALFGTYDHHPLAAVEEIVERTRTYWGSGTAFEFLAPSWVGDPLRREQLARYERLSATPDAAAAIVAMANDIDVRGILPSISQPTLILHRTDDGVFPVRGARALAQGIPGARLVELRGHDHLLFADPDPVLDLIDAFLDEAPEPHPPATTVLTTLVAVITPEGSPAGPEHVRAAIEQAGGGSGHDDARVATAGAATVFMVDGPAHGVRVGQQLVRANERWRVGVHTAEVAVADSRPAGAGVLIAAAVAEQVDGSGVLVTRTVTDLVAGSGLRFAPTGELHVPAAGGRWVLSTPLA
jgi:pimeloyl-ACP methyl ester carboxylesterase